MSASKLSHVDPEGKASMVDISAKGSTQRLARARAVVEMAPETADAIRSATIDKGEVLTVAKLAGIMAAKRTADLIPLCHPLSLNHVDVSLSVEHDSIVIESETRCQGRTGVEMEALTAASVAALTVYDMAKAIDRGMRIASIELIEKRGGASGHWQRRHETEGD